MAFEYLAVRILFAFTTVDCEANRATVIVGTLFAVDDRQQVIDRHVLGQREASVIIHVTSLLWK